MTAKWKLCTACLAGAVLLASLNSSAVANPLNPATAQDGQLTAPNQWKTVPADALTTDVRRAPLTGDGSN
jgi:hypothetical protein